MFTEDRRKITESFKEKIILWVRKPLCFSLLVNATILCISILLVPPVFRSNDDWAIANIISGIRGRDMATPYIYFSNIMLSTICYWLYQICFSINWYAVIEEIVIFTSLTVLTYVCAKRELHKKDGNVKAGFLIGAALAGVLAPNIYTNMQFSQTAGIGSIAGAFLLMSSFRRNSDKVNKEKVTAFLLIMISSMYRSACFLLILPFAFYMVLEHFLCTKEEVLYGGGGIAKRIRACRKMAYAWLAIGIWYLIMTSVQSYAYQKWDQKANYIEYNTARASFIDYPLYPYSVISENLKELGVSENDYALMASWTYADKEFITADLLTNIAKLQPPKTIQENWEAFLQEYRIWLREPYYLFAILLSLICLLVDFRKMKYTVLYSMGFANIIMFYFKVFVGRMPSYVVINIFFAVIYVLVYALDLGRIKSIGYLKEKVKKQLYIIVGVMAFGIVNFSFLKNIEERTRDDTAIALYETLNSREEDVFLVDPLPNWYLPQLMRAYSVFSTPRAGSYGNLIFLGGWTSGHPVTFQLDEKNGLNTPLKECDKDNVYVIGAPTGIFMLQMYLYEHTGKSSTCSLVGSTQGVNIFKVTGDLKPAETVAIQVNHAVLSEEDDIVKVDLEFISDEILPGDNDLYIQTNSEDTGQKNYYMLYEGNHMSLEKNKKYSMSVRVPKGQWLGTGNETVNIVVGDSKKGIFRVSQQGIPLE